MDRSTELEKFLHKAKFKILGKDYSVSFAFIGDTKMQALNEQYRGIDKTTDILSFPLTKEEGEILVSKRATAKKAKEFEMKTEDYLRYLLIHGLLHLKGMDHGSKMESKEREFCRLLRVPLPSFLSSTHDETNHSRNRHRNAQRAGNRRSSGTRKRIS